MEWRVTIWEWSKSIFAVLGIASISVAGVTAAAFVLFKLLGEKWLENKFAERLEAYRAEQARELERLRHTINRSFDRIKRLHDREYEVLPDIWARIVDAKNWADGYLSEFQSYANLEKMDTEALDEFLNQTEFSEAQKRQIKIASDRQDTYVSVLELYRHANVREKLRDASLTLSKSGIFVIPALRADIERLLELIFRASLEHNMNREYKPQPRVKNAISEYKKDGPALFKSIEEQVAARLWEPVNQEI